MSGFKGRAAEYAFASDAALRGYIIGFPSIESIPFDFYLTTPDKKLFTVQVKGCFAEGDRQAFKLDKKNRKYTLGDFDVLVLYIHKTKEYYFLPQADCEGLTCIRLSVNEREGKYERYRNDWGIFTR